MRTKPNTFANLDWLTIGVYLLLVFMGWLNIYAATYDADNPSLFDLGQSYGKQAIWIGLGLVVATLSLLIEGRFYRNIAYGSFIFTTLLVAGVLVFGKEINGAKSWYAIGSFTLQPSEFAKIGTALAISAFLSEFNVKAKEFSTTLKALVLVGLPAGLILLQPDAGSTLVFASFIFVLYREGLSGNFLLFGLLCAVLFVLALLFEIASLALILCLLTTLVYASLYANWKFLAGGFALIGIPSYVLLMVVEKPLFLIGYLVLLLVGAIVYNFRLREIRNRGQRNRMLLVPLASIGFMITVGFIFNNVMKEHQRTRITLLLGEESKLEDQVNELKLTLSGLPEDAPQRKEVRNDLREKKRSLHRLRNGVGWNLRQSKIAIGSGGFAGKGFLQGTQTKYNYVPEQSTDFIFCTVGEEWGFLGSTVVIGLFLILMGRLVMMAERQRSAFSRIYGYCVASILFFHMTINIGMTIGLAPVIGIPLPFFSYGGSSLWAFTALLFIFLRLDTERMQVLR
ncbi:MAG: rod shape-determining protein RodA [Salibacteraceae bacterium]